MLKLQGSQVELLSLSGSFSTVLSRICEGSYTIFKKMDCKEAKDRLISLLTGELSKREKKRLLSHLAACGACSEEEKQLEKVWQVIGALPEMEVPRDLRDATLTRIEEMLKGEEPDHLGAKIGWHHWDLKPLASVFGGVAMSLFSLWVLRGVTEFERLSAQVIFHGAALMTGLLIGAFLLAMDSLPLVRPSWRWASRTGLVSLGLTMLGTLFCPKMSLIEWWEMLPPGQFLLTFSRAISHGAFGVTYAFVPFFLAVLILGRRVEGGLVRQTLIAGGLFLFLLLPVIYLQALPLSVSVFFTWVVGSVFGAFMGGLTGAGIYKLAPGRLAAST